MLIREEQPRDIGRIHDVNEAAFGRPDEARLVDVLRDAARPFLSLVAEENGEVVGHICFTPVEVERYEGSKINILGLAPMSVHPAHQRRGIGSKLVEAGVEECRRAAYPAVVVLGHPNFYPRFGFRPAAPNGLVSTYDVPEPVFMVLELQPGALRDLRGVARYHPAFGASDL